MAFELNRVDLGSVPETAWYNCLNCLTTELFSCEALVCRGSARPHHSLSCSRDGRTLHLTNDRHVCCSNVTYFTVAGPTNLGDVDAQRAV